MGVTLEQIQTLPAETLAYELLPEIPPGYFRRTRFIANVLHPLVTPSTPGQVTVSHFNPATHRVVEGAALAVALQCLVADGVLVPWPPQDPQYSGDGQADMLMVTAWGKGVLAAGAAAPSMATARRRLGVELHPALASKLRDSIAVGAFENAAWLALRSVESRVRKLAGDPRNDRGARYTAGPLMDYAFNAKNGVLSDPDVEQGEREGQMYLFKGAFLAVRNTLAHTDEEQWNDSIEAAEYVLFADLLMRRLDHVERRIAVELKAREVREEAEAAGTAVALAGTVAIEGVKAISRRMKG